MKFLAACLLFSFSLFSCSKKSGSTTHAIAYKVMASNYTQLKVTYMDETGQTVNKTIASGWTYSFTTGVAHFPAQLNVYAMNMNDLTIEVSATASISVDGGEVQTQTHSAKTQDMSGDPLVAVSYTLP